MGSDELADLWEWRRGFRSHLPPDEQHLTRDERGVKAAQEAKAAGRNIERLPDKAYF